MMYGWPSPSRQVSPLGTLGRSVRAVRLIAFELMIVNPRTSTGWAPGGHRVAIHPPVSSSHAKLRSERRRENAA
jgi:hypothetical protein